MSKAVRKNSLDLLGHKNKDEILLYISEAKIEIYFNYIISYETKSFSEFNTNDDLLGIIKNGGGNEEFDSERKSSGSS